MKPVKQRADHLVAASSVKTVLEAAEAFSMKEGLAMLSSVVQDIHDSIAKQFLKQTYNITVVKEDPHQVSVKRIKEELERMLTAAGWRVEGVTITPRTVTDTSWEERPALAITVKLSWPEELKARVDGTLSMQDHAQYPGIHDPGLTDLQFDLVTNFVESTEVPWALAVKYLACVDFDLTVALRRYKQCEAFLKVHGLRPRPDSTAELIHYLNVALFYIPGTCDKSGASLLVFNARYYVPDAAGIRRLIKLLSYICDKAANDETTRRNGIVLISNLQGVDRRYGIGEVHRLILQMLEYCLPICCLRMLVVNAPWWAQTFSATWKPGVCEYGTLSTDMSICNNLSEQVDPLQLPRELGGSLSYKWREFVADQLASEAVGHEDRMVDVDLHESELPASPTAPSMSALQRPGAGLNGKGEP
ncbi:Tyrosine-protein phosphatase non-receptor type 9 [Geranomyces michiganensis]|nr:Tyrosine-protein phosphatase non-receptor type 9 [Geranomyces michiganensis]